MTTVDKIVNHLGNEKNVWIEFKKSIWCLSWKRAKEVKNIETVKREIEKLFATYGEPKMVEYMYRKHKGVE